MTYDGFIGNNGTIEKNISPTSVPQLSIADYSCFLESAVSPANYVFVLTLYPQFRMSASLGFEILSPLELPHLSRCLLLPYPLMH